MFEFVNGYFLETREHYYSAKYAALLLRITIWNSLLTLGEAIEAAVLVDSSRIHTFARVVLSHTATHEL